LECRAEHTSFHDQTCRYQTADSSHSRARRVIQLFRYSLAQIARETMPASKRAPKRAIRGFTLTVIHGPLLDSTPTITKHGTKFRIGRTRASKLQIKDETVSEKHGELKWNSRRERWEIVDRGSSNGTAVNGVELEEGAWRGLNGGDEVRIGEATVVRFEDFMVDEGTAHEGTETMHEGTETAALLEQVAHVAGSTLADAEAEKPRKKKKPTLKEEGGEVAAVVPKKDVEKEEIDGSGGLKGADPFEKEKENAAANATTATATKTCTVLEHIEQRCAALEHEIVERGQALARGLREAWEGKKKELLASLHHTGLQ
jgi:hypothetical protein